MRRIPTIMASASAAGLAALAVTVAVPALGNGGGGNGPASELSACLRAHGLPGAPDDATLKPWLGERLQRADADAKRALEACMPPEPKVVAPGPSPEALRSCLANHGVDVPGDPAALKHWLLEHGAEAQYRDALKACNLGPPPCDVKPIAGAKTFRTAPATRQKPVAPAGT